MNLPMLVTLTLFIFLATPQFVYAYLDPGSGSYIIQILVSFFAIALVSLRFFFGRIIFFFRKILGRQNNKSKQNIQIQKNERKDGNNTNEKDEKNMERNL